MGLSCKITRNDVSPRLSKLAGTARNKQGVLRAMGTTFKSITEGTFNSAGAEFRPQPWRPKADGSPSILQKSTTMAKSFHLEVTGMYARVSNPMVYASIHQFGGKIEAKNGGKLKFQIGERWVAVERVEMPARPFYPVQNGKLTPKAENLIARAGERMIEKGS